MGSQIPQGKGQFFLGGAEGHVPCGAAFLQIVDHISDLEPVTWWLGMAA